MEHIVQFAISIDDKTIRKRLEENAYEDICKQLVNEAKNDLPGKGYSGYRSVDWRFLMEEALSNFIHKNKEEIIDAAAEKLKDSFLRTKAYREKMNEVITDDQN